MADEREAERAYLAGVWTIDRWLWHGLLMNAFRRKTKSFLRSVDEHGYDGAALIVAARLWQGLVFGPAAVVGGALFGLGSRTFALRLLAYPIWAIAAVALVVSLWHGGKGDSRKWTPYGG
jgi:hypothetical protein